MKLTLNRREEKEGMLFKKPIYYLDVNLDATPEELELVKKHKWDKEPFCDGTFSGDTNITWSIGMVMGKPQKWRFTKIEHLAYVENAVIENAKKLQSNLKAVVGFASSGPREVEL